MLNIFLIEYDNKWQLSVYKVITRNNQSIRFDTWLTGVQLPGRIPILTSWGHQWNLLLGTSYRRYVRIARNCISSLPGFRDPVPCAPATVRCTGTQNPRVVDISVSLPLSKWNVYGRQLPGCPSAFYDLGCGVTGQTSSPHQTMRELRRRHFDDRGSAPWEDSYSHLLGTPMEHSAGNILQTIGAHRQKRYQQEASGIQGSCLLCSRQGQVHKDSEPQGGRHLHVSPPVQVERAGAATPGLPNTVILPPVSEAEHAGSQHKPCRPQKSAEQKAAEHAKECLRCHQLECYEGDCPQAADEPMGMPRLRWPQWRSPLFPVNRVVLSRNLPLFLRKRPPDLLRQVRRGSVSGRTGSTSELRSCGYSAAFTTGHGGYESQPDLVICHVQGLTVEAAASDFHGSGQAGQLSVMQLTAATRWPGSRSESCERGWCWASLGSEAPFPTTLTTSSLIWWWREAMFQTLKWHIDLFCFAVAYITLGLVAFILLCFVCFAVFCCLVFLCFVYCRFTTLTLTRLIFIYRLPHPHCERGKQWLLLE